MTNKSCKHWDSGYCYKPNSIYTIGCVGFDNCIYKNGACNVEAATPTKLTDEEWLDKYNECWGLIKEVELLLDKIVNTCNSIKQQIDDRKE